MSSETERGDSIPGIFYAVGTGPGSGCYLTLEAVRTIERCAVIAYPVTAGGNSHALDTVRTEVNLTGKKLEAVAVPMSTDPDAADAVYRAYAAQAAAQLAGGDSIAFLTLGDVTLYSTAAQVALYVLS